MNCPNCGAEERSRSEHWIFFKCDSYLRENMHVLTSDECDLRKENKNLKKRVKELEDYIKSSVQKP